MSPFVQPGVYHRYDAEIAPAPLIVDVSRSGREYPTVFRSPVAFTTIHDNVSAYVDEIWADAPKLGGTLIYALFPHMYIDANRNELDIDPDLVTGEWPVPLKPDVSKRGLGLLKSKSRYGEAVQKRKLTYDEVEERLDRYHRPYYRELASNIERLRRSFNKVYQLSCHCMSAVGASTHPDPGKERPTFCLGNLNGRSSSKEFIDFVADKIRSLGFTCTINTPYSGGELIRRFGDPEKGVESILVEINKKYFMDVDTFRKTDGFTAIKSAANHVLAAIAARARDEAQ